LTTRACTIYRTMAHAAELNRQWKSKGGDGSSKYTRFMPFNEDEFRWLLECAVAGYQPGEDEDVKFLAVGCGPGSELLIARDICGLDAHGFDRDPEYVAAARSLGLSAEVADAEFYTGYHRANITWFNRVARDAEIQRRIEAKVWRETAVGSVVACANLEAPPPPSWFPVLDDWGVRRGIWMKTGAGGSW
jgi:hypothetical protein